MGRREEPCQVGHNAAGGNRGGPQEIAVERHGGREEVQIVGRAVDPQRLTSKEIVWPTAKLSRSGEVVEKKRMGSPTKCKSQEEKRSGESD